MGTYFSEWGNNRPNRVINGVITFHRANTVLTEQDKRPQNQIKEEQNLFALTSSKTNG